MRKPRFYITPGNATVALEDICDECGRHNPRQGQACPCDDGDGE